jgi:hypothetical protein
MFSPWFKTRLWLLWQSFLAKVLNEPRVVCTQKPRPGDNRQVTLCEMNEARDAMVRYELAGSDTNRNYWLDPGVKQ